LYQAEAATRPTNDRRRLVGGSALKTAGIEHRRVLALAFKKWRAYRAALPNENRYWIRRKKN
jgi:hypothetical protein